MPAPDALTQNCIRIRRRRCAQPEVRRVEHLLWTGVAVSITPSGTNIPQGVRGTISRPEEAIIHIQPDVILEICGSD